MAEAQEQLQEGMESQLEQTSVLPADQKIPETIETNEQARQTLQPAKIQTLVRRRVVLNPVYIPSFNYSDWAFFTGLLLVTIASVGTRLYQLNEPHHVA